MFGGANTIIWVGLVWLLMVDFGLGGSLLEQVNVVIFYKVLAFVQAPVDNFCKISTPNNNVNVL